MQNRKNSAKRIFNAIIFSFSAIALLSSSNVSAAQTSKAGDELMMVTILGAVGSFAYACYKDLAPCSLEPGVDTDKLTFSIDSGVDGAATHHRIALGADWVKPIYSGDSWEIVGRLEGSIHSWDEKASATYSGDSGFIIGVTPVFHYQLKNMDYTPFIEMGAGPHLLSQTTVASENKATQFQFGNILGLGIHKDNFEIGYRYLHISNIGIEEPNPGADFHNLHIGYHF